MPDVRSRAVLNHLKHKAASGSGRTRPGSGQMEPRTQEGYIRAVRKLTAFLKRSPDTATVEDLRNFQLHLVDTGTSPITLNATLG